MDAKSQAIRIALTDQESPRKIADVIRSFQLPYEEEAVLIAHEARGKSIQQIADEYRMSPETVKRRRRKGFARIAQAIGL